MQTTSRPAKLTERFDIAERCKGELFTVLKQMTPPKGIIRAVRFLFSPIPFADLAATADRISETVRGLVASDQKLSSDQPYVQMCSSLYFDSLLKLATSIGQLATLLSHKASGGSVSPDEFRTAHDRVSQLLQVHNAHSASLHALLAAPPETREQLARGARASDIAIAFTSMPQQFLSVSTSKRPNSQEAIAAFCYGLADALGQSLSLDKADVLFIALSSCQRLGLSANAAASLIERAGNGELNIEIVKLGGQSIIDWITGKNPQAQMNLLAAARFGN